jgi:GTP pyrophosphokinase
MTETTVPTNPHRGLSWWPGGRGPNTPEALQPVLAALRTYHPKADTVAVLKAYEVAERVHRGQVRKSGEPYIKHPVAVANILADLGMTASTLVAGLLHDTVEDTDYTLKQLEDDFGITIANLVDGVTKLDKVTYGEAAQAETVRKMMIQTARDIRVLVIKLADRLHNARTWKYVSAENAARKARETLEIYAPLAHRLGMNKIKWELEDLSFATLYPKMYAEVERVVAERAPARDEYLGVVSEQVKADLRVAKIKGIVTGRPKHYYSIYQKMIVRGRDVADIYDLVGVRVLVDTVRDCYSVLGAVHARWNPVPGRFKDYIAMPKFNMYQSLHTTVIGPSGKPVEIQIRTHEMHRRSEFGVAAHWRYKEGSKDAAASGLTGVNEMAWLRQLVDWQRETEDPDEFLDDLRYDIGSPEVYAFTPKGDVIMLPAGSTPVDFAYAVHTEVGHRTMGARVNSRLVTLETELHTGDVVEIFTNRATDASPSRDWLTFVKSPRARSKIRQWFTRERREEATDKGKSLLAKQLRKLNLPIQRLMSAEALAGLVADLRYENVAAMYAAVGEGQVSAASLIDKLVQAVGGVSGNEEDLAEVVRPGVQPGRLSGPLGDPGIAVQGLEGVQVKLAKCCTPVPGDQIVGFVTQGSGVSIHRSDCQNLEPLRRTPERLVEVSWTGAASGTFLVQIQVEALDRHRLLSDITHMLSEHHVNILSASVHTTRDRVALSRFSFEMAEPQHLGVVLNAVRRVDGVYDVYRITGSGERRDGPSDATVQPAAK